MRYDLYGERDAPAEMSYYFWLVRQADTVLLVDCGFDAERGASRGYHQNVEPRELLRRMGVLPEDVTHVIASHMHLDHIGNLALFPNATVTLARSELEFWTGKNATKHLFALTVHPEEIRQVEVLRNAGLLNLVDERAEVVPGVRVQRIAGHTPGQLVTMIDTNAGEIVLASDAAHYYEEFERDMPFSHHTDVIGLYESYAALRELGQRPGTRVIAGHDPRDLRTFELAAPDCLDLTRPLGAV